MAFAKICVEVEATKEIPHSIEVEMKDGSLVTVTVEVPWAPQRCSYCSIFGHTDKFCSRKPVAAEVKVWMPKQVVKKSDSYDGAAKERDTIVREIQVENLAPQEQERDIGSSLLSSANRFAALEDVEQSKPRELIEDEQVKKDEDIVVETELVGARKPRVAAAGVAELMKTLKLKKKGPIDKGRKQVQIGSSASRSQMATHSS